MKIALIQQPASTDREANIHRGLQNLEQAARMGAQLAAFAELAFDPFYPCNPSPGNHLELAEPIPGPTTERFAEAARRHGMVTVLNLYEREGQKAYDSSPILDADGSLLGITRMVHITDYPQFHEQDYYTPGDTRAPVYDTALGRVGIAICYDRHYPEYMRALALDGAELVVVPQAGTVGEWPPGLYEAELQVASFQNGYFCALVNRVGKETEMTFAGQSFITSPQGEIIAQARPGKEQILVAELDLSEIEKSPAKRLFLRDRRPDIYPLNQAE